MDIPIGAVWHRAMLASGSEQGSVQEECIMRGARTRMPGQPTNLTGTLKHDSDIAISVHRIYISPNYGPTMITNTCMYGIWQRT